VAGALLLSIGLVAGACVTATSESAPVGRIAEADVPAAEAPAEALTDAATGATDATTGATEATEADGPTGADEPEVPADPTIGYISLDESQAFVQTISSGVREAAADAGLPLVECDSGWTRPGVLACAAELAEAGVTGVISMQPFPDLTETVCEALGDAPTIGIIYDQGPCQVSRFEIDQAESGRMAGSALGAYAAKRFDCEVKAYVSLESSVEDEIGGARMDGYLEGYQEHCKLPRQTRRLSDAQHLVTAQNQFVEVLDEIKGKPIMVAGVSEDAILGAMSAAQRRERTNQVRYSGQLADPAIRKTIACDRNYIASVAQFPERFGATVVPALVDAAEGRAVPPVLQAELELVTADNVRELFPDTPACDA
jgi:ribose transport system substrate-binding protein